MKTSTSIFAALIIAFSVVTANASTPSAVDSHSCKKLSGTHKPFILVLKTGENFSEAVLQCMNDAKLPAASFSGLGTLENPTLSFFNHETKQYQEKTFPGVLELISLSGNMTEKDGKHITHFHVTLSNDKYQAIGGHLKSAFVGPTIEISVMPLSEKIVKKWNEKAGLDLITIEN